MKKIIGFMVFIVWIGQVQADEGFGKSGRYITCHDTSAGHGRLLLRQENSKWTLSLAGWGDIFEKVNDVKEITVLKSYLFDQFTESGWGLKPWKNKVRVYAVKFRLVAEKTVLGWGHGGCIPEELTDVEVTTLCTDIEPRDLRDV